MYGASFYGLQSSQSVSERLREQDLSEEKSTRNNRHSNEMQQGLGKARTFPDLWLLLCYIVAGINKTTFCLPVFHHHYHHLGAKECLPTEPNEAGVRKT